MKLYIKYMVSLRCKIELNALGLRHEVVELGMVEILADISEQQRLLLKKNLIMSGLEFLDDKRSMLIEKIKKVIIEMIYSLEDMPKVNYSEHISKEVNEGYTSLSNIFSG